MNIEYMNIFVGSCVDVLKVMSDIDIKQGDLYIKSGIGQELDISLKITLEGDFKGFLYLDMSRQTAMKLVRAIMHPYVVTELDELSKSALTEVGTMISNQIINKFESRKVKVSTFPPDVIVNYKAAFKNYKIENMSTSLILNGGEKIQLDLLVC